MKKILSGLLFCAAAFLTFHAMPASAQSETGKPGGKSTLPADKPRKRSQEKKDLSAEQSEAGEAARFLNEIENGVLKLKIYKLADTEKNTVAPQIAGSVTASGKNAERFQNIAERIFSYHKLTDLCSGILFEDKNPTVFTYRLRSISFSTAAFELLTDDETAALIAHEIGHIYFGKELMQAREANDDRAARIVELKSDAIALLTLKNLNINPEVLIKALKKLIKAREKLGLQTTTRQSASMEDRVKLAEYFMQKFK